jgi:hypothetical protein
LKKDADDDGSGDQISKLLVLFPEQWRRSKKQYVRLAYPGRNNYPKWLGRKYEYSLNRSKAKVEYGDPDLKLIEDAPDYSTLQIRNDKGEYKFEKKDGKWLPKVD